MPFSRQARIMTLLVIDSVFFFIELVSGYLVGSLALVADSFHMLNDVLSLVVALYTIKLATSPSSSANSYGWQRAEILGALINGVFLVALCVSIALEALGRIIAPPEVTNPMVIVIVGSLGLLSNIVGLFLFHEHGHSHGGHSHDHGKVALPDDDAHPESRQRADSMSSLYQHPAQTRAQVIETAAEFGYGRHEESPSASFAKSPPVHNHGHGRANSASRRNARPRGKRMGSGNAMPPVPGQNEVLAPHTEEAPTSASSNTAVEEGNDHSGHDHAGHSHGGVLAKSANEAEHGHSHGDDDGHEHGGDGHGHSHGSMNMRGVFLHVLGDALGNVGVIAAGLVIWFCHGRWTLYFDPGVSLLITCIIFSSAVPLVKSASYILLQGVPSHVSLDAVRSSIKAIPGVVSVHELHVWQLSESTIVASVHVLIRPGRDYMQVASAIREGMHSHGIHSVTIQPEFSSGNVNDEDDSETACLIRCPPEECGTDTCCPPITGNLVDVEEGEEHDHEHGSHDGHQH